MANHCVLLTGATGFVGRNFLLRLLSEASVAKVIVPVRSAKKLEEQLREEGIEIPSHKLQVVVTRDDQWNLTPILSPSEGQTTLVHCAGINFGRSYEEYQKTNVLFFEKLLSEIGRVDRALVLSSQAAGGPTPEGVLARTENDADLPITFYGQSKLEMERVALQWAKAPLIILRPPMILGPRDTASLPLFQMARSLVRFRPSGRAKNLSFISVDDLVEAMWRVVSGAPPTTSPHQPFYYVASSEPFQDRDLILKAAQVVQKNGVLLPIPKWTLRLAAEIFDKVPFLNGLVPSLSLDRVKDLFAPQWVIDSARFQKDFGWTAKENLTETLDKTYRWYQKRKWIR